MWNDKIVHNGCNSGPQITNIYFLLYPFFIFLFKDLFVQIVAIILRSKGKIIHQKIFCIKLIFTKFWTSSNDLMIICTQRQASESCSSKWKINVIIFASYSYISIYISLRTLLFSANVTDETLFDIYNNLPNYWSK